MLRSIACLVAAAALSGCATTGGSAPVQVGSRVLAEWQGAGNWWVGTVSVGRDGVYTVSFDDGTKEAMTVERIEPLTWGVGSQVTCLGTPGRIVSYQPGARTLELESAGGVKTPFGTGNCYEERGVAEH